MSDEPDYMQTYDSFWKRIVENEDGTLNKDQVARELADALTLQGFLSEVYSAVSRGRVSKPFTLPTVVLGMYDESLVESAEGAINELISDLEKHGQGSYATVADVVAAIRELTDVVPVSP